MVFADVNAIPGSINTPISPLSYSQASEFLMNNERIRSISTNRRKQRALYKTSSLFQINQEKEASVRLSQGGVREAADQLREPKHSPRRPTL